MPHLLSSKLIDVESETEMVAPAELYSKQADAAILCAACADFTPSVTSDKKIKRDKDDLHLQLNPTHDIAAHLGSMKTANQKIIGFALETNNEYENAQLKLAKKNFDFIVLNSLQAKGAGFQCDTNKISIVTKEGREDFPLKDKSEVARDIIDCLVKIM